MAAIVRIGDPSSHGGVMIQGGGSFKVNGLNVCVDGDLHNCPIHGITPVSSSISLKSNGKSVVKVGCTAACGAVITAGSPDTNTDD
jgi:uncharacterized Zn-binding protein involved in type VI secretion